MNNEFYENIMEHLLKEGALDVYLTNIMMKKNRPAIKLSVLSRQCDISKLSDIIFKETSTIGVRMYKVQRETLDRSFEDIETKYGSVKVKISSKNGDILNYAPEYEDVKRIANINSVSIKSVYNEAIKNFMIKMFDKENNIN